MGNLGRETKQAEASHGQRPRPARQRAWHVRKEPTEGPCAWSGRTRGGRHEVRMEREVSAGPVEKLFSEILTMTQEIHFISQPVLLTKCYTFC